MQDSVISVNLKNFNGEVLKTAEICGNTEISFEGRAVQVLVSLTAPADGLSDVIDSADFGKTTELEVIVSPRLLTVSHPVFLYGIVSYVFYNEQEKTVRFVGRREDFSAGA